MLHIRNALFQQSGGRDPRTLMTSSIGTSDEVRNCNDSVQIISDTIISPGSLQRQSERHVVGNKTQKVSQNQRQHYSGIQGERNDRAGATARIPIYQGQPQRRGVEESNIIEKRVATLSKQFEKTKKLSKPSSTIVSGASQKEPSRGDGTIVDTILVIGKGFK